VHPPASRVGAISTRRGSGKPNVATAVVTDPATAHTAFVEVPLPVGVPEDGHGSMRVNRPRYSRYGRVIRPPLRDGYITAGVPVLDTMSGEQQRGHDKLMTGGYDGERHATLIEPGCSGDAPPISEGPTPAAMVIPGGSDNAPPISEGPSSATMVTPGCSDNAPPISEGPSSSAVTARRNGTRLKMQGLLQHTAGSALTAGAADWSAEYIAGQQRDDPDIGPAFSWCEEGGGRPPWSEVKSRSPALRAIWQQWESIVLRSGIMHRIFHDTNGDALYYQVVIPYSMKVPFLELCHADAAGHLKLKKCIGHVQRRAWWFTWRRDLQVYIASCAKCSAYFRGRLPKHAPLQAMSTGGPSERWAIDLTGPHCLSDNNKYILTAVDTFTRFIVAVPIRNKEAVTVANVMIKEIFLRWGLPLEVLTDQGKEFEAELNLALLKALSVVKLRTGPYTPSGLILSVESNQNVESKMKNVESKVRKRGVHFSPCHGLQMAQNPNFMVFFRSF